jgi:hypothetical protein
MMKAKAERFEDLEVWKKAEEIGRMLCGLIKSIQ